MFFRFYLTKWLLVLLLLFSNEVFARLESSKISLGSSTKIVLIDIEAILEQSLAVESIKEQTEKMQDKLQKELTAKEAKLKKQEESLTKQRGVISSNELENQITEFNKQVSITQQEVQHKKTKLEQAHLEAINKINEAIVDIVSELAQELNFQVAIPTSYVIFADEKLNITSEVIKRLNSKVQKVVVNLDS